MIHVCAMETRRDYVDAVPPKQHSSHANLPVLSILSKDCKRGMVFLPRRVLNLARFALLAVFLLPSIGCSGSLKTTAIDRPLLKSQVVLEELEFFRRPVAEGHFVRVRKEDDPVEPLRWIDLGMATLSVAAMSPNRRLAVVKSPSQTIVYDLVDRKHRHEWNELFQEVEFNSDGTCLVTVSSNKISVWDTTTFQSKCQIIGEPLPWRDRRSALWGSVAIDPKGEQIAVNNHEHLFDAKSSDGLLIYSVREGQFKRSIDLPPESQARFGTPRFLLDGRRLLCTCWKASQSFDALYDTNSGNMLAEFLQDGQQVAISPDGRSFAIGPCEGTNFQLGSRWKAPSKLTICDAESGRVKRTIEYALSTRQFAFSPDSQRLLVAYDARGETAKKEGDRGHLVEWDVVTGKELFKATDARKSFATVAYSPSGNRRFATTEAPNGVDDDVSRWLNGWDVESGIALEIESIEWTSNGFEKFIFFPKGEVFIDAQGPFELKNVLNNEKVLSLPDFRCGAFDAEFMPSEDKFTIHGSLYDVASGKRIGRRVGSKSTFLDGGRLLFSKTHDHVEIIDVLSGSVRWHFDVRGVDAIGDAAISRNGECVAIAFETHPYRRFPQRVVLLQEVARPFEPIIIRASASAVAFHPDGKSLLLANEDAINEYEVPSGRLVREVWKSLGRTFDMSYSNDGRSVAIGGVRGHQDFAEFVDPSDGGWAVILDASTGRTQHLDGHASPVTCVAFSEDNSIIATGSMDSEVRVWNPTGKLLKSFGAHRSPIRDVAINSDNTLLLSTALDGAALWDLSSMLDPPRPTPSVARTFQMEEEYQSALNHAELSEQGHFFSQSTFTQQGPTPEIHVAKQHWNLVQIGKRNSRVLNQRIRTYPHWFDLLGSETSVQAPPKTSLRQWPEDLRLLDISTDQSLAALVNRKERQLVVMDTNSKRIHSFPLPDLPDKMMSREASFSRSSNFLIVQTSHWDSKQLDVYDLRIAKHRYTIKDIHIENAKCFAIDPKERTLLVRQEGSLRELYHLQTGQPIASKVLIQSFDADYSDSGHFIVATPRNPYSEQTLVELYDPHTLERVQSFQCDYPAVFAEVTPDGKRTIVGHLYGNGAHLLSCWNVETGKPLWSRAGSAGRHGVFSPTGKYFLCGDKALWTLWEVECGEVQCVIALDERDQRLPQESAVFAPQEDALFFGGMEGPQLWSERR